MATTTLEKAIASLKELPEELQDELGGQLLSYIDQWRELQMSVAEGIAQLRRGEGVEVRDGAALVREIKARHGHT